MNGVLGTAGVALGFAGSVLGAITLAVGLRARRDSLLRQGRTYALLILGGAFLAAVAMERALITRDFTVQYVAENGSSKTPALFNVATLWGALEGSIILWALILAGYIAVVAFHFRRRATDPLVGWALLTMFVVAAFFFGLMLGPADPFVSFNPPAGFDGPGPNPLLQNHVLMIIHPPMLYLGYVGFTVPFAFAIAALVTGRIGEGVPRSPDGLPLGKSWVVETRRWTLFAWGFLSAGIVLGAWWSYEVLGWGGYWAWDPVENASFLPWLTGTAYLHSVIVQERRGMLRVWNLSLLCATFALTILGTFITRSGVLESVHAFTESAIGPAILGFFTVVVLVSVGLIGWRGDRLRSPGRIDSPLSREAAFLGNNLLFAAFAFVVLLGTVFPLIVEAINTERVSVGTPYFNRMTMPIGFALLFLMAVAPALPWRKASGELLLRRLQWPAWVGVGCVVFAVVVGARGIAPLIAFGLAGFAGGAAARQLALAIRRQHWGGIVGRTNGGMVVHIGVVVIAVAFAASSSYVRQAEFDLLPGESATFAGHTITYIEPEFVESERKIELKALITIDGAGPYAPSRTRFNDAGQKIGTPAVRSTLRDDVQLALIPPSEEGVDEIALGSDEIRVRMVVQPLVAWLWVGGGIIVVGTVLAAIPTRRRVGSGPDGRTPESEPEPEPEPVTTRETVGVT